MGQENKEDLLEKILQELSVKMDNVILSLKTDVELLKQSSRRIDNIEKLLFKQTQEIKNSISSLKDRTTNVEHKVTVLERNYTNTEEMVKERQKTVYQSIFQTVFSLVAASVLAGLGLAVWELQVAVEEQVEKSIEEQP